MKSLTLKNKHILITRPQQQAIPLCQLIEQHHGTAICLPVLEILPLDKTTIAPQLQNLKTYQWLIFISVNAVNFALAANDGKIDSFQNLNIAAVGQTTAQALKVAGLNVTACPETIFNSETLLTLLPESLINQKVLIIRGLGGREKLADELRKRGATVDYLAVYQRCLPTNGAAKLQTLLQQDSLAMITISSGEALENLLIMAGAETPRLLAIPLIVVSHRICEIAVKYGFKQIVVAASPTDAAIFETLLTLCNGEDSDRRSN